MPPAAILWDVASIVSIMFFLLYLAIQTLARAISRDRPKP